MPNGKSFFRLDNKVTIITGASRGIGRSIAIAYARYGAKVIVSSRKIDACEEVVDEIRSLGGEATATVANISDKSSLEDCVNLLKKLELPFCIFFFVDFMYIFNNYLNMVYI